MSAWMLRAFSTAIVAAGLALAGAPNAALADHCKGKHKNDPGCGGGGGGGGVIFSVAVVGDPQRRETRNDRIGRRSETGSLARPEPRFFEKPQAEIGGAGRLFEQVPIPNVLACPVSRRLGEEADGHQAPRLSGTTKVLPKRSYQHAQVVHHCTFPALSRDLLDMAQDRGPGSRPGKQEDGFQSMQAGMKRYAVDLIHALLTMCHP